MRPSPVIVLLKAKSPPQQGTLFPEMVPVRGHTRRDGTYVQPYQAIRQTAPESEIARIPPRFAKVEWDGLMSAWYAFDQFGRRMTGPDGAVRRFRTAEAAKRWGQEQDRRARAEVRQQYRAEDRAAAAHDRTAASPPARAPADGGPSDDAGHHSPLSPDALRRLYREAVHGDGAGPRWAARDKIKQLVAEAGMTLRDAFHAANLDLRAYLASRPTSRSEGR